MKRNIKKSTYKAIYRLLNNITPLKSDCGKLCNAICCLSDEENMGIYLLPGEESLFTMNEDWINWETDLAEEYDFPESWEGEVHFIKCKKAPQCPREMRPLQCRFFPLTPHFKEDGEFVIIYSTMELPYSCPLIDEKIPLDPDFKKVVYTVWTHLIRDPQIYDLVEFDSEERYDSEIHQVYPPIS